MKTVGVRDLKNRLSEYLRLVRSGEEFLVTDRGEVIAELRRPRQSWLDEEYPALAAYVNTGKARLGERNDPEVYPALAPALQPGTASRLLDEERAER